MIPFINRLSFAEWILLVLVYTEKTCSFIVNNLIPSPLLRLLQKTVNFIIHAVTWVFHGSQITNKEDDLLIEKLKNANNIKETLNILNPEITIEEHVVITKDKYILALHRIPPNPNEKSKGIVYLHHGLLMCSDIWVCHHIKPMAKNLPLLLHSLKNYDVWLGNNRGNKYSGYHLNYTINDVKFWDFSIDEFAFFDIPDSIDYILKTTKKRKISSIIAFSQGSAQTFGALSLNPELNHKVENFIALAPAMTPPGLYNKLVDTLMKTSPQLIYLFFGKKILLSSANTIWKKTLPTGLFNKCIEMATKFLFNWNNYNITKSKTLCFNNLYSPTSVKTVVHWFQILNAQKFKLFQEISFLGSDSQRATLFHSLCFPTLTNIKIPVLLIYGGLDSLVDIEVMKKNLPENLCFQVEIPDHEHLDIIWGDDVDEKVWPHVLRFMQFWNEEFPIDMDRSYTTDSNIDANESLNFYPTHHRHHRRENASFQQATVSENPVHVQQTQFYLPFESDVDSLNKNYVTEIDIDDVSSTIASASEYTTANSNSATTGKKEKNE